MSHSKTATLNNDLILLHLSQNGVNQYFVFSLILGNIHGKEVVHLDLLRLTCFLLCLGEFRNSVDVRSFDKNSDNNQ